MSNLYTRLKDGNNYIFPELYSVDINNLLYSRETSSWDPVIMEYTATQDCICNFKSFNGDSSHSVPQGQIYIDNTLMFVRDGGVGSHNLYGYLTLKKGQKFKMTDCVISNYLKVYGLKVHS